MIENILQKEIENLKAISSNYANSVDFSACSFSKKSPTSISSGIFVTSDLITTCARDLRIVHNCMFTSVWYSQYNPVKSCTRSKKVKYCA